MKKTVSIERLRELLDYEPQSGIMTWKEARGCVPAGKIAGFKLDHGYIGIRVDGVQLLLHRVAYAIYFGEWPDFVDHINGMRSDNRIDNLRNVTRSENGMNMALPCTNKSGTIGVFWNARDSQWSAHKGRTENFQSWEL